MGERDPTEDPEYRAALDAAYEALEGVAPAYDDGEATPLELARGLVRAILAADAIVGPSGSNDAVRIAASALDARRSDCDPDEYHPLSHAGAATVAGFWAGRFFAACRLTHDVRCPYSYGEDREQKQEELLEDAYEYASRTWDALNDVYEGEWLFGREVAQEVVTPERTAQEQPQ